MNAMDSIFLPRFTIGENAFDASMMKWEDMEKK